MADKFAAPEIVRAKSADELAHKAFEIFMEKAHHFIETNGVFRVAVSGGHTPEKFFALLGEDKSKDWSKVHLFWVDERYVPPTNEKSNYHLAEVTFLKQVPIPAENIHRIPTEATDYNYAARQYENTIREVFKLKPGEIPEFDMMILGMGSDGHVGSLFPGTFTALDTEHLVNVVYVMDDKLNRITMTYPVMHAARNLLVLLSGTNKAKIVREVFQSEPDEIKYPAHLLWPILHKITWLMDEDAGKLL